MDGDRALATRPDMAAIHSVRVEWQRHVANGVDRDQAAAAGAAEASERLPDRRLGGGGKRLAAVPYARGDVVGRDGAHEQLARTGGRHRAGPVVGIGAAADDRRVTDAPGTLVGEAAR